ncbi:MAG: HAMP domain-containing sensor histidine kinase [Bacteroidales bacterium]
MNMNFTDNTITQKPFENEGHQKKESVKLPTSQEIKTDKIEFSEDDYLEQMDIMQETNEQLAHIVEMRTKKIKEVVAANTKFISVIGHDLRSPLSSVSSALELLRLKLEKNEIWDIEEYINLASNSVNQTLMLLESLLEWAISQRSDRSFNPVKINLYCIFSDEIDSMNILAMQKNIKLKNDISPDLHVCADMHMVKTVLRNLLSNALKYTYSGGVISISASEDKHFVEVAIKDKGIGISEEAQKKLFNTDKFYSTTGINNESGSGLGLVLCNEFIKIHGGSIEVNSAPGCGSEFKFTLPHYI